MFGPRSKLLDAVDWPSTVATALSIVMWSTLLCAPLFLLLGKHEWLETLAAVLEGFSGLVQWTLSRILLPPLVLWLVIGLVAIAAVWIFVLVNGVVPRVWRHLRQSTPGTLLAVNALLAVDCAWFFGTVAIAVSREEGSPLPAALLCLAAGALTYLLLIRVTRKTWTALHQGVAYVRGSVWRATRVVLAVLFVLIHIISVDVAYALRTSWNEFFLLVLIGLHAALLVSALAAVGIIVPAAIAQSIKKKQAAASEEVATVALLRPLLSEGPKPFRDILKVVQEAGLSRHSLERAKRKLGATSIPRKTAEVGWQTWWSLPEGIDNR